MTNRAGERLELVHRLFAGTGRTYDCMVNVTTFGLDRLWKARLVGRVPPSSSRVLDLGCGTGISTFAVARRYRDCVVVGVELREEYIVRARRKQEKLGLTNVEFVLCRAEDYRSVELFDCVLSSYLVKYVDIDSLTKTTRSMLKEGGVLLMHDFTYPPPGFRWLWHTHFWLLQHVAGPFFPRWRTMYYGLPSLIKQSQWMRELEHALRENGFSDIRAEFRYISAIVSARK